MITALASSSWRSRSACTLPYRELFFDPDTVMDARDICYECPVFEACTAWSLPRFPLIPEGVYAGLSSEQRGAIYRGERRWRDWRPDWEPHRGCRRHHKADLYALDQGHWFCIICNNRIEFVGENCADTAS